ncbi:MAG TPA: Rieske (2Fe-2S) protein [Candidatus Sulfotelmatobacter sp.]|nr:Rieske (2Fe-2S) protein [Candidatus Sulfotelmatobacter sp.]
MTRATLILAVLAVVGCIVAAALHASPALLGAATVIACAAVAVAAGAAAVALHAPNDLTEPRHARGPTLDLAPLPEDVVSRRGVFNRMWGVTLGAFALLGVVPLLALQRWNDQRPQAWARGTRLVSPAGTPLRPTDLAVGGIETVFPEGKVDAPETAAVLIRLDEQHNVAYSKICTHAGCPVAIYRRVSQQLYCPCHQSVFDVTDGARPVSGPAPRPLPQLPLGTDAAGYLVAEGDFDAPVGPDTWWRTL